ncbi:MAG: hypothetical protein A3J07_04750 [Candidatus Doudnabacteria bacterium RIFCSPLOWO2_02_FULL_49_13]|uniref:Uncharacterized protein n=1 Tax=Candidatus Doudnabacteria bacterium RIFCSPHIGHO2_12_FULL_48_16 TaxID=1817838 RepID=A0A1F5PK84_9BACT|nr:MAG: hypothetical protein A3B77_01550 [Candidatus Doudnabacteria bacterium RIFCSPHIGHO2_02_FULL_49_24]OGE90214.1 MAG: hypothetical protein A3E29_03890 [Candidatus Doudnabacteria bacterium RIFCSPHIGHO2_12_FULL_48_16]OGE96788.1 MAG: hypothetical protein A2990_00555 [Candidatus Doudnabacteria bacterium RIFCSPLOWO2_01_FULL_49_40]OGF02865.1 MAG: hypothetical protein A3H14_00185 [Candidatus Doudnabacteria bacterium RIFCSPLOWO2_12_FULL_49_8]OGF03356.1 MAG: hypothetical protein A3J07_04750 [Candidat
MFQRFWDWYQKYYRVNLTVTVFLFALQLFHLYWMFTDIILLKLTGQSYFGLSKIWGVLSTFIDYSEIPALVSTNILYIYLLREKFSYKYLWFLFSLNIQLLHIFWITDEIVIKKFNASLHLFHWSTAIAWIAILIDYLEVPVIFDTARRLIVEIKNKS